MVTGCDIVSDTKMVLPTLSENKLICEKCNKQYSSRNGLWCHKKKCVYVPAIVPVDNVTDKELILRLIKQNTQLIEQNGELVKNGMSPTNNTTHIHNNTFNLNFVLKDMSYDAVNIADFVNNIKTHLSDLETKHNKGNNS